MIHRAKAKGKR